MPTLRGAAGRIKSFALARAWAVHRLPSRQTYQGCEQGKMQFDDATLLEYIDRFYGYGNYRSQHWLVGMEEGGGDNLA